MLDSFQWIIPSKLAGSGRPGWMSELDGDLAWLAKVGIRQVVSLTAAPLEVPPGTVAVHHFPIPDMGIPTPRAALGLCARVLRAIDAGEPVLLHCRAGLGRTGTMLAACLVSTGLSAAEAIGRVRRVSPHYIQSEIQERFVAHYADFLAELGATGELEPPVVAPAEAR